jgi:type II secretory ATPase GspE/PulE/Tfp pilus assembly ATPase PilB-like protein
MSDQDAPQDKKAPIGDAAPTGAVRERALREELKQLVGVVGPGPLVDILLERAFQMRATDIHLDPTPAGLRVRIRVDGLLHDVLELPTDVMSHVISRVKLMANMDITERRFSQDGHIANTAMKNERDIRVGSGPTIHGERLVLRLMPDNKALNKLDELGLEPEQVEIIKGFLVSSYGMILSVGPVGSGKSTTMYTCLEMLNAPAKSLATIEDPVERRVEGVNQIQTDPRINFGFVEALRGVLRQDPNVMMVGEIRDPETAHIACRAGLTGIVVLSTLHANDTASTIDVFREFDVPRMFMADSLLCIISQRLLRKVCQECREAYHPDEATCQFLGINPGKASEVELFKGTGCDLCFQTGHRGRTGVFEILGVGAEIREAILHKRSHAELKKTALEKGMTTLEENAKKKVLAGITSVEEVHRVLTTFPS